MKGFFSLRRPLAVRYKTLLLPLAFVHYLAICSLLTFFFCSPKKRNKKRAPLRPNSVEKTAFAVYLERRKELHRMLS